MTLADPPLPPKVIIITFFLKPSLLHHFKKSFIKTNISQVFVLKYLLRSIGMIWHESIATKYEYLILFIPKYWQFSYEKIIIRVSRVHFCVCVSKSLRKWTQTDTKVTFHPPTRSQMKGMAKDFFTPVIMHWFCPDKKLLPILFFMMVYKDYHTKN